MATSSRGSEAITPREKLINAAREKLLTAIDEARELYFSKRGQRRASSSSTIPPTHQYRITNEDENFLLWGEEKVADINTILHSWPDRNLSSCCEGLDKGQLTINVVVKTIPDTVETKTFSLPAEQEGNAEASGVNGPWANEKYNPVQEALHDRLRRQIALKIGHHPETTPANRGMDGSPRAINPLRSDPSPPNQYFWTFSPSYPAFPATRILNFTPQQVDECNLALNEGHLQVETVVPQLPQTRERNSLIPSSEPRNRTARQRRADETRTLLHNTIVNTIGREIQRRNSSNNHINPTRDDPDPPNGYRWAFSESYEAFPDANEKRLKDWTIDEHDTCRKAVQNGWLRVESLLPGQARPPRPRQSISAEETVPIKVQPAAEVASPKIQAPIEVPKVDRHISLLNRESSTLMSPMHRESSTLMSPTKPIPSPAPSNQPSIQPNIQPSNHMDLPLHEKLNSLLAEPFSQLKTVVNNFYQAHIDTDTLIREEFKKKNEQISQLKSQVGSLEQNIRRIRHGNVVDLDRLTLVRDEGRREGQELAMKLMRESEAARKEIELRTHFTQIERAREEGRQQGLRQAREEGTGGRNEATDEEGSNTPIANGVTNDGVSQAHSSEPVVAVDSYAEQTITTTEYNPDQPRRSARPPRPSSVRGFQAINKQTGDASSPATNGNKRNRSSDSSREVAESSNAGTPREPEESKTEATTPEEDIYGASPPPKKAKVLDSLSSAKRRGLNEQWKRNLTNEREWPHV